MGNSSPLRTAIRNEDIEQVGVVLTAAGEGAPDAINEDFTGDCLCERGRNIQSPLHTVVSRGKLDMAELLIKHGADVSMGGRSGMTPLHYAAKNCDLEMCKLLVKYGADVNGEDNHGQRALHSAAVSPRAARSGNTEVLQYVLKDIGSADDINFQDADGRTALHEAAFWGHCACAQYLLDHGADKSLTSQKGQTALDEATHRQRTDMVALLSGV